MNSCLCSVVTVQLCNNNIVVLQHPSELKVAKATVPLVKLALKECQVVVGESSDDFDAIRQQLMNSPLPTYVVYPSEHASSITDIAEAKQATKCNLIFIDGTWRKALKILKLNIWLEQFQFIAFSHIPDNKYILRKAKKDNSLSTLEAIALTIETLEQQDTKPLLSLLEKMTANQLQHMPKDVQLRYQQD